MSRGRPKIPGIFTPREWQVLLHLRHGLTNAQIAQELGISIAGAKYHVSEILTRLGVRSRKAAAAWHPDSVRNTEIFSSLNESYLQDQLRDKLSITDTILNVYPGFDRYVCELPDCHFAVIAENSQGINAMRKERRVLNALSDGPIKVPRVMCVSEDDTVEIRHGGPRRSSVAELSTRLQSDHKLLRNIIGQLASMLVSLHSTLGPDEATELTKDMEMWPASPDWIREGLAHVIRDSGLLAELNEVVDLYEQVNFRKTVLCQGDPIFQNLSFDSEFNVKGISGFYTACARDPEWDLRYLVTGPTSRDYSNMDYGIEKYAEQGNYQPDRQRVLLYNAVSAIAFLAFRKGIDDDYPWCGRTLTEDLSWTRSALSKLE